MQYFRLERPKRFFDNEFLGNLSVTARRMSRSDPMHYVNISFYLRTSVTNEYTVRSNTFFMIFFSLGKMLV